MNYQKKYENVMNRLQGLIANRWIAWLEKQGEQKQNPYSGTSFEYNGHTWGMCARDYGVEILFDGELKAFLSSEKSFIYPIHPQLNLAPKNAMEAIKEERIDNQNCVKPTDKVEPKFKDGDWIIDIQDGEILHINKVRDYAYYVTNLEGASFDTPRYSIETWNRLWTIQDAKVGDVLQLGKVTAIFKEFIGNENCRCYCSVYEGEFEIPSQNDDDNSYGCYNATPATKEQCDLLFQKMKEKGYEWDDKKKILIRFIRTIKQNDENAPSIWSDEDEYMLNETIQHLEELIRIDKAKHCACDVQYYQRDIDWLKSIKERIASM